MRFNNNNEYGYDYKTSTDLWINNISDESKSSVELSAKVFISYVKPCTYLLRLENTKLNGESLNSDDKTSFENNLNTFNKVVFRLNTQGDVDSLIQFSKGDNTWSRNIKRAIISSFQLKSKDNLRELDHLDNPNERSAVVYETDILGRCRTTYTLNNKESTDKLVVLNKRKSLQRCSINDDKNTKDSAVQYVPYKTMPV